MARASWFDGLGHETRRDLQYPGKSPRTGTICCAPPSLVLSLRLSDSLTHTVLRSQQHSYALSTLSGRHHSTHILLLGVKRCRGDAHHSHCLLDAGHQ